MNNIYYKCMLMDTSKKGLKYKRYSSKDTDEICVEKSLAFEFFKNLKDYKKLPYNLGDVRKYIALIKRENELVKIVSTTDQDYFDWLVENCEILAKVEK